MARWLEQLARDLQFAARNLIRTPGFSALAIMSLAVGIMAATAMYSVLHAVVLDPFPYKDVDRLMSVRVANTAARGTDRLLGRPVPRHRGTQHDLRRHDRVDHQRRALVR